MANIPENSITKDPDDFSSSSFHSDEDSSPSYSGLVIALIVGAVLLLGGLIAVLSCVLCSCQRTSPAKTPPATPSDHDVATTVPTTSAPAATRSTFTFMQWNVLASVYVHHFSDQPMLKDSAVTAKRYNMAADEILSTTPDVVTLQEVDTAFWHHVWAAKLAPHYDRFWEEATGAGTPAVLIRKGGVFAVDSAAVSYLAGGAKGATAVRLKWRGAEVGGGSGPRKLWVASVHLPGAAKPAAKTIDIFYNLSTKIAAEENAGSDLEKNLLLAGDFNATPKAVVKDKNWLTPGAAPGTSLLAGAVPLKSVPLKSDENTPTSTGTGNESYKQKRIDYIFASVDLQGEGAEVEKLPISGTPHPWNSGSLQGASDHAWLRAEFKLT